MRHAHHHTHEAPQFDQIQNQAEAAGAYFSRNREKFVFGAGICVGFACARLMGGSQVVIVKHVIQGAAQGV